MRAMHLLLVTHEIRDYVTEMRGKDASQEPGRIQGDTVRCGVCARTSVCTWAGRLGRGEGGPARKGEAQPFLILCRSVVYYIRTVTSSATF